jgi:hypothetical protein
VLELSMVSAHNDQAPPVIFDQPNNVSNLHCHIDLGISTDSRVRAAQTTTLTRAYGSRQPGCVPSSGIVKEERSCPA